MASARKMAAAALPRPPVITDVTDDVVSGTGVPGATIRAYVNGALQTNTATVDGAGDWTLTLDAVPNGGSLTATQTYAPPSPAARVVIPFVPSNNLVAFCGDSRLAGGVVNGNYDGRSPILWLRQLARGALDIAVSRVFAEGGKTTAYINTNWLPSAIASDAQTVVYMCLGNDPSQTDEVPDAAASVANLQAVKDAVFGAGKRLVLIADYLWPSHDAAKQAWVQEANAAIRGLATADGQCVVPDLEAAFTAAADDAHLIQPDGTHLEPAGGQLAAKTIWAAMSSAYATVDLFARSGKINGTIDLSGTGGSKGSMAGVVATGWSATGPATITAEKVTRASDGAEGQRFYGTLGASESITFFRDFTGGSPATYSVASGDIIESMMEYEVAGGDGDLRLVQLETRYSGGTAIPQANDGSVGGIGAGQTGWPAAGYNFKSFREAFAGLLRTTAKALPGTPNRVMPYVTVLARMEDGTSVDVSFFRPEVRELAP